MDYCLLIALCQDFAIKIHLQEHTKSQPINIGPQSTHIHKRMRKHMLNFIGQIHRCTKLRDVIPIEKLNVAGDIGDVDSYLEGLLIEWDY
jgi:hypothetical protein